MSRKPLRVHYSDEPLLAVESREQPAPDDLSVPRGHNKPLGLWYSINADWLRWCRMEGFGSAQPRYGHMITVVPERILHINSPSALEDFTREFACDVFPGFGLRGIDWPSVARQWGGLEIWPYLWSCRLGQEFSWYYGWDCASGCVWDASAVTAIRTRERRRSPAGDVVL